MKKLCLLYLSFFTGLFAIAQDQKVVADCTVWFDVTIQSLDNDKKIAAPNMKKTVYIKGSDIRTDLESNTFTQSTIRNTKNNSAVILREFNGNKYMTLLDYAKWKQSNKKFDDMKVSLLDKDTKDILGYQCNRAEAVLKNGLKLSIYYTQEIIPSVTENEFQFKGIPGFVLEYESQMDNGQTITFSANKIEFTPVPASKFIVPKEGYRIL